ncbi:MAG: 30S ribosomal protein S12 methylthiotransferase RimO [Flavobacteriales bacterium]|nr:30S ribosomal protein S12 methylthiotransferase RimO [Flavobacteriales bacterium]
MRTKSSKRPRINVVTLGCSKNIFDSEVMMAQLSANKYEVTHESEEDAPIVIINTCGFIDNAKEESVNTILRYAEAKKDGQVDKVYVTGCLSQRYGEELSKEIPEVDSWFGTRELPRLLKTLKADYKKELIGERLLTTPTHYAYLKIAEGCDRPCAFCAIPLMRGKHRSTPIEDLVAQAGNLAAKGTRELILIAQDLTFYGLDIYKERRLAALIRALSEVEGIDWIRLHYAYPAGFPEDVLEEIRSNPKVCKYLDIPLQHGTTKMLKAMRRGITREKTDELLAKIRETVPGIAVRTTLIIGFPGETEEDFEELKSWVQLQQFERLGVFQYSHEEDTHAFSMEDDVPAEVKAERASAIMQIQEGISYEKNQKLIGKQFNVLVDKVEGQFYVARTEFDSPDVDNEVLISTDHFLRVGDFATVEIIDADSYDVYAVPSEQ